MLIVHSAGVHGNDDGIAGRVILLLHVFYMHSIEQKVGSRSCVVLVAKPFYSEFEGQAAYKQLINSRKIIVPTTMFCYFKCNYFPKIQCW